MIECAILTVLCPKSAVALNRVILVLNSSDSQAALAHQLSKVRIVRPQIVLLHHHDAISRRVIVGRTLAIIDII